MNASEYLNSHWVKNEIWKHLERPKHQRCLWMNSSFLPEGEKSFADVGCGLGHSTQYMADWTLDAKWTGIDFDQDAIDRARAIFPRLRFHSFASIAALGDCEPFDGVVCSEVVEHVENDRELIEALWRMTADTLVVTTPNRYINDPGHLRVYTEETLAALFDGIPHTITSDGPFFFIVCKRNAAKEC